ncbi:hypothetical protein G7075_03255 [Phycicoccus sp. HDW14]|uniref:hypothetical protein n=1 Tax=Phycicoccus sp. HDW14 TaxID=2714941 RepID=UPI001409B8FF|nr:hypothetical protein [Phycicoccus sp. HDW14]QIM20391.1 hypothetical protein G7075_03255 [Phycicoccus sp. HDW14]
MAQQGRHLSLEQALAWNPDWSHGDRVRIAEALGVLPDLEFVVPAHGKHVGVWVDGHRALEIKPGYLSWPVMKWTLGLPSTIIDAIEHDDTHAWFLLSTHRPHEGRRATPGAAVEVCPTCWQQLPATKVCGNCA